MRFRLLAILILALVLSLGIGGDPMADQRVAPIRLTECTPPAGLQVPAGQGIVVSCRLRGQARLYRVEFLVDGEFRHDADAGAGEVVSWSWVPARAGEHTLTVAARLPGDAAGDREEPSASSWQVVVVPGDAPVRLP